MSSDAMPRKDRDSRLEAILASQSWGQMAFEKLAAASTADIDAVIRFAEDIPPPTEPVLDYITEVDTRRALFDDFRALCPPGIKVYAVVFAIFMVAPISELRSYLPTLTILFSSQVSLLV